MSRAWQSSSPLIIQSSGERETYKECAEISKEKGQVCYNTFKWPIMVDIGFSFTYVVILNYHKNLMREVTDSYFYL